MRLKTKLLVALGVLTASLVAVGGVGFYASRVAINGLDTVYADRVIPLGQIKEAGDLYAIEVVGLFGEAAEGRLPLGEVGGAVTKELDEARSLWDAYLLTYLTPEESVLAERASAAMKDVDATIAKAVGAAQRLDAAALVAVTESELPPQMHVLHEVLDELVVLQLDVASQIEADANRTFGMAMWILGALALAGLASVALAFWNVIAGVMRPLAGITGVMTRLSRGERGVTVPGIDRHDEIGEMAKALQVFKDTAEEAERLREQQVAADRQAAALREANLKELAQLEVDVTGVVRNVVSAVEQLRQSASTSSASAHETSRQSTVVAAAAEQATGNVQTVASAAEELAASVREIGQQVSMAASSVAGEATSARRAATAEAVRSLAASAQPHRPGRQPDHRHRLADQPPGAQRHHRGGAGRRGRQGLRGGRHRGEDARRADLEGHRRDLRPDRRGAAARRTRSSRRSRRSPSTIRRIDEISSAIASSVEEQGAATGEIAQNVQQAAYGTQEVSINIATVNSAAQETGRVSAEIAQAANDLDRQTVFLRDQMDAFIGRVRAA
jgi:methyl-accepting chemotaxis protein